MTLEERLRLIRDYCLAAEPTPLSFAGENERWALYREMVRARHEGALASAYRLTRGQLGEASFAELARNFLEDPSIRTRYFWRIPISFFDETLSHLNDPVVREIAEYEMLRWKIRHEEAPPLPTAAPLDFDARPLFKRPFAIFRARHPRLELGNDEEAGEESKSAPRPLLLFRNADEKLRELSLSENGARLIEQLSHGQSSLKESVLTLSEQEGFSIDAPYLEKLSTLLAALFEEGFLLGSIHALDSCKRSKG